MFTASRLVVLTVRGGGAASHRDGRDVRLARRDDREYGQYLREEQRRQPGCPARPMQRHFRHGLLGLAVLVAGIVPVSGAAQERPKADEQSAEVVVRGCANGRALVPMDLEGQIPTPLALVGRAIRLNGPKAVIKDIERQKGRLIEVTGLVRRSDLQPQGPSTRVGGMRVTVGGTSPMSMDPTRADPARQAMASVVYMDVSGYRVLENSCPRR